MAKAVQAPVGLVGIEGNEVVVGGVEELSMPTSIDSSEMELDAKLIVALMDERDDLQFGERDPADDFGDKSTPTWLTPLREWAQNSIVGASLTFSPLLGLAGCSSGMLGSDGLENGADHDRAAAVATLDAGDVFEEVITTRIEPTPEQERIENMLADGRATATWLDYQDAEHPLIVAKDTKQRSDDRSEGKRALGTFTPEDFEGATIFICPFPQVKDQDLTRSWNNKRKIMGEGDETIYEMTFNAKLNSKDLKKEAVKEINKIVKGANVTESQITMVSYNHVAVTGKNQNNSEIILGEWPKSGQPGIREGRIQLKVRGTAEQLTYVRDKMSFGAKYARAGISFKQDLVDIAIGEIDKRQLWEKLFGAAENEVKATQSTKDAGAILNLAGILTLGASGSDSALSFGSKVVVERNLFNRMVQDAVMNVSVFEHLELDSHPDRLNALSSKILDRLFKRHEGMRVDFDANGNVIPHAQIANDLSKTEWSAVEN